MNVRRRRLTLRDKPATWTCAGMAYFLVMLVAAGVGLDWLAEGMAGVLVAGMLVCTFGFVFWPEIKKEWKP